MLKAIIFSFGLLCFCASIQANALTPVIQMMEGEIRAGLTTSLGGYHTGKAQISGALGIEGRYNFKGTPWDCGLMLDLSTARRGYEHLYNDVYDRWQSNRTLALAAMGEYIALWLSSTSAARAIIISASLSVLFSETDRKNNNQPFNSINLLAGMYPPNLSANSQEYEKITTDT